MYMGVAKHPAIDIDDDIIAKAITLSNVMHQIDGGEKVSAARTENIRKIMSKLIFH